MLSKFHRSLFTTLALIAGLSFIAQAQLQTNFKQHISYLAGDSLHGRMTGSKDESKAAAYIIEQFKKNGIGNLSGNHSSKKYLQHFVYHPKVDSVKTTVQGNNVVAYINNNAASTIIIGAHYDHLG